MENIGKETILEKKIQENKIIDYFPNENIMKEKNDSEYKDNIKTIIKFLQNDN